MAVMSTEEAYAAFVYQAVCEDGMLAREEHDALLERLAASNIVTGDPSDLLKRVDAHLKALGPDLLTTAAAALPARFRHATYDDAVKLAVSDDDAGAGETAFLAIAGRLLGIHD